MIPNYKALMQPLLELAKSDELVLREAIEKLANVLGLSQEERTQLLPSGRQAAFSNRVGWAKTYLTKAGLLETTKRGHFQITQRGSKALNDPNLIINIDYLRQFPEFSEFKDRKTIANKVNTRDELTSDTTDDEVTPDEALRNAYQQINDELAADILNRTRNVTPAFFEQLLVDLLVAMGYGGSGENAAQALGKSGDNGIDGVINQDPLGVDQIYIQAKRYKQGNNVGAGEIRDFFGALNLKKAHKGLFITTADFTPSAKQTAQDLGVRIVLINGKQLAKLMLQYNIGSRDEQVLHLKKIDEEFFE